MWGKIIPILGIITIAINAQTVQKTPRACLVTGRVIDEKGAPLPSAIVVLIPNVSVQNWESMTVFYKTDAQGVFRIEETCGAIIPEQLLYAFALQRQNADIPISPPFPGLRKDPIFGGQKVLIRKSGETDLGDVLVQLRYGTVLLRIQHSMDAPFWQDTEKGDQALLLRVRNANGDVLGEDRVSEQVIDIAKSLVTVALPEGKWRLEVGLDKNDSVTWHKIPSLIVVSAEGPPLEVALPVQRDNEGASGPPATYQYEPAEALRKLQGMGIEFSSKEFVERVVGNNAEAVALFLAAGMDPNAKGRLGNTALTEAAAMGLADIAGLLLANGADVNARNKYDMTVLMVASGTFNSNIVKQLLASGARVNERTTKGTALIMAVTNDKRTNVKLLLAAGADVNVKDSEGKSPMALASEFRHLEIIELLRQYGAK